MLIAIPEKTTKPVVFAIVFSTSPLFPSSPLLPWSPAARGGFDIWVFFLLSFLLFENDRRRWRFLSGLRFCVVDSGVQTAVEKAELV